MDIKEGKRGKGLVGRRHLDTQPIDINYNDTQHSNTNAKCCIETFNIIRFDSYAECCYVDCHLH